MKIIADERPLCVQERPVAHRDYDRQFTANSRPIPEVNMRTVIDKQRELDIKARLVRQSFPLAV